MDSRSAFIKMLLATNVERKATTRVCPPHQATSKINKQRIAKVQDVHQPHHDELSDDSDEQEVLNLRVNSVAKDDVIWVTPTVEGVPLKMERDTELRTTEVY